MKTLLTFSAAFLLSMATMAADRYPSVTIKSKKNFEIVVDGRRYFNDNTIYLNKVQKGFHEIKVYEKSRGFFGTRLRLVSSKSFFVRNSDLRIMVDRSGFIDIDETGGGWGRNDRWNDHHNDRGDRNYDRNSRY